MSKEKWKKRHNQHQTYVEWISGLRLGERISQSPNQIQAQTDVHHLNHYIEIADLEG